jgi:REP element-mobilizing transposase RayT
VEFYLKISYSNVIIHQYVIMPNHIHVIIKITDDNIITLGKFIKEFKSKICRNYNKLYNLYKNSIWQRNYHEHIIRNPFELHRIEKYIKNNPYTWIKH